MAKGEFSSKSKKSNSYKPYDANNSLVRRVTNRVSQYLPQPSNWLSRFLTSKPDNQLSESESVEDEVLPPPSKRIRSTQTSTTDYRHEVPCDSERLGREREEEISPIRSIGTNTRRPDYAVAGPSGLQRGVPSFLASTPAATDSEPLSTFVPKVNGGDEVSESESASSTSIAPLERSTQKPILSLHRPLHQQLPSLAVSDRGRDNLRSKPGKLDLSTSLQSKERSSFDTTVFYSPFKGRLCGSELSPSLLNCTRHEDSSFYRGNTTYGGASSSSDSLFRTRAVPSEMPIIVKPIETTRQSSNLSTSTNKILKALEEFSTPVLEARKMVVNRDASSSSGGIKRKAAPYRELIVPQMPDLLRVKRRDARRFRAMASQSAVSNNQSAAALAASWSSSSPKPPSTTFSSSSQPDMGGLSALQQQINIRLGKPEESPKEFPISKGFKTIGTVEKKSRVSSLNVKPEVPDKIPKLSFSSLPKFDPGIVKSIEKQSSAEQKKASLPSSSTTPFTFSKPIELSKETPASVSTTWKFSKPLSPSEPLKPVESKLSNCLSNPKEHVMTYEPPKEVPLKRKQPSSSIEPSKAADIKPKLGSAAFTLKSGSVMDILRKPEDVLKSNKDQWECKSCYTNNSLSSTKCVACETPKEIISKKEPESKDKVSSNFVSSSPFTGFGDKFKMSADQWECNSCFVRNTIKESKCVSCCQPRVKNGSQDETLSKPKEEKSKGFGDMFKPEVGSWECKECLVMNKAGTTSCISCTSKRSEPPAAVVVSNNNHSPVSTNISTSSVAPLSAFFKKPEGSWECESCLVQNKADITTCVACGTNKPGTKVDPKASQSLFSFGVPANQKVNALPESKFSFGIKTDEKPAVNILFGIPPTSSSTASSTTTTTVPSLTPASTFKFGSRQPNTTTTTTTSTFSFGIPPNNKDDKVNPVPENKPNYSVFSEPNKKENVTPSGPSEKNEATKSEVVPMSPDPPPQENTSSPFIFNAVSKPADSTAVTTALSTTGGNFNVGFSFVSPKLAFTSATSTSSANTSLTNSFVPNVLTSVSSNLINSSPFSTTVSESKPVASSSITNPLFTFGAKSSLSKVENTVNSSNALESSKSTPTTTEAKNVFGLMMNKPANNPATSSESVFSKVDSNSKPFTFGGSDKKPGIPNCNTSDTGKPGGFQFHAPKVEEPKVNAVNSHNAEPPKMLFGGSGGFGTQSNAFTSTFGSAQDKEKTTMGFGSSGGFSFKPSEPSSSSGFAFTPKESNANQSTFTFGSSAATAAATPTMNHTNSFVTPAATTQPFGSSDSFGLRPQSGVFGSSASTFGSVAPQQNVQSTQPSFPFGTPMANDRPSAFNFSAPQGGLSSTNNMASAPVNSGFSFGQPQPSAVSQAPPAFDPNAKPVFNFSSGQAPPTFSASAAPAPGGASDPLSKHPERKFRKALRRTVQK